MSDPARLSYSAKASENSGLTLRQPDSFLARHSRNSEKHSLTLTRPRQAFVIHGSLARGEFTRDSDLDWVLIVDGIEDPNHHALFLDAKEKVKHLVQKGVGREGTFAALTSSHDLIHKIGGEDDTNKNLTRMLLLLLSRCPLAVRWLTSGS